MTGLAPFHPQIVHFVVALLFVGVIARALSLLPLGERFSFLHPAAAVLVIVGSVAAVLATLSGTAAHGPVERIPGVRGAVVEHEEAGEWARNVFIVVGLLEIAGLGLRRPKIARGLRVAAGVTGVAGLFVLYRAAERGGDLVYRYAGGIGLRSGDSTDVRRLLVAGLYNQAVSDRAAGRPEDAARLVDELARRDAGNMDVWLVRIDSRLHDRKDPRGTLAALDSVPVAPDDHRLASRVGNLRADAFLALGLRDSAKAVIEGLLRLLPDNPRLKARLDTLTKG